MPNNIKIGQQGESIAADYLVTKGYQIIERNWRFKKAEIDIIAKSPNSNILVFIEVKTRSYTYFGEPSNFVDDKKKKLIQDAASQYMIEVEYDWEIRFDIVGIVLKKESKPIINHFEDAFFS